MEIAIYARVSTQRQQHQQTIEQQLERLRAHIAQQPDWRLAPENVFRDDGHSGAKMSRPGLDRLRDRIAMASFSLVLITAPDRLARNYVHQVLLIEELKKYGCRVEFLDRPMTDDPHDQLVLQIRGAVAEYERSLIGDRMRRGRLARLRGGQLLPWTVPPYGFLTDAERPRDPNRVRLDPVASVIVGQIFTWYTESEPPLTLYKIARRLTEATVLTPMGRERWNVATIRGILRNPAYAGTAYSDRRHVQPAQTRRSALKPIGSGPSSRPAPQEDWIGVRVPAIITQEMFAAAQERLKHNKQMASRHNTKHQYLLRGLVSCGRCLLSCTARCALDDGEFVAPHPSLESGLIVGSPVDRHRPAPDDQRDDEQMLVILDRPIDRESDLACARQLFKRFPAKPFGEILGIEALIMDQPRQALRGGLLISLRTSEFGLIACLFFNDRRDKGRDGFDLVTVYPRQQLSDIAFNACRSGLCCHSTNRISQVVTCADTHIYRKCPDISTVTQFWGFPKESRSLIGRCGIACNTMRAFKFTSQKFRTRPQTFACVEASADGRCDALPAGQSPFCK
ncbi:MAG: recombinase family protein [Blastocatellia bacterium]|nr:recombinase family protein [Blastocatellia bacterium]